MATGLACSVTDCGYTTTTQVPDDTDPATRVQFLQLQMQELQMHTDAVHKEGGGAVQVTKQDYYCMKWSIDDRLEECKAARWTALSKEQGEKLTVEVEELSDLLLVHLRDLVKALPQDADRLKGEYDTFYAQKIPVLEELRRYCNLEPTYESGIAVLSPHPDTEADGMKFSEEDNEQCTTDYVEQCKDEETKSEEVTSEEFHGRFGKFTGKKLEGKASTNHANQVSIPNNFKMKFKEVEEMRKMPDSDKLIGHLSNLVKEDSKELEEKELMETEVANYPDMSEVTKFEETKSEKTKGELVVLKPASGRGQQYKKLWRYKRSM